MTIQKTIQPPDLTAIVDQLNSALSQYADKDWNYSRISLLLKPLDSIDGPYGLWVDFIDMNSKEGLEDLKTSKGEISWGQHHSDELGILELVSLRVNKALIETTSDEFWGFHRPVVRLTDKKSLAEQGVTNAIWYEIHEVQGDVFDNR
jgi:hypothetical protein